MTIFITIVMTNYTGGVSTTRMMHTRVLIKHKLSNELAPPPCRNGVQVHGGPDQAGQAPPIAAQELATRHQQPETNQLPSIRTATIMAKPPQGPPRPAIRHLRTGRIGARLPHRV